MADETSPTDSSRNSRLGFFRNVRNEAIGGLSAGILGTFIGFPLDTIKTRMQTDKQSAQSSNPRSSSILTTGRKIISTEGWRGFYRGVGAPLISLSLLNTINFASYAKLRKLVNAEYGWDWRNAAAGVMVGPFASTISTIEHVVKTQMQLDNVMDKKYRSSGHCISLLVKSHGPTILYTGHITNTVRESLFLGSYFFAYEGLKVLFLNSNFQGGVAIPMAGGIAGASAWFISFPLDCIKAGVQGQAFDSKKKMNGIEVTKQLLKKGVRGLYRGVTPSIIRAFLVSGTRFSAYEATIWALKEH